MGVELVMKFPKSEETLSKKMGGMCMTLLVTLKAALREKRKIAAGSILANYVKE